MPNHDRQTLKENYRQWYLSVKDSTHMYMEKNSEYDAKIIYRPGIDMKIPDNLSRTQPIEGEEIELDLSIHTINISAQKQADLQKATEDDEELKMLKQVIINGWPEDVKHS